LREVSRATSVSCSGLGACRWFGGRRAGTGECTLRPLRTMKQVCVVTNWFFTRGGKLDAEAGRSRLKKRNGGDARTGRSDFFAALQQMVKGVRGGQGGVTAPWLASPSNRGGNLARGRTSDVEACQCPCAFRRGKAGDAGVWVDAALGRKKKPFCRNGHSSVGVAVPPTGLVGGAAGVCAIPPARSAISSRGADRARALTAERTEKTKSHSRGCFMSS